jgi:NAD(P)-dependent dehydrogenase (short-subunit alcohol dehydrogenase family)
MKHTGLFDLTGRVAVVTGGGSGIGRSVCIAFAEYGANVVVADLNLEAAHTVVAELTGNGEKNMAIKMDVTDPGQVQAMVDAILDRYDRIDILFNNAGISKRGPAESFSLEDWNRVLAVNLTGMFTCAQSVGKVMIRQKRGKIINTSSVSGKLGHPGNLAYAAAKHGVIGMTKVMAVEWGKYNVNVNCIGPGVTKTPMTMAAFEDKALYDRQVSLVPMGRLGETDDLIGAVIYLASDASNYVTGQTLYIEGGRMSD